MITDGRAVASNKFDFDDWGWWHNALRGAGVVCHKTLVAFAGVRCAINHYAVRARCIAIMSDC
jgi:hypothetical protein